MTGNAATSFGGGADRRPSHVQVLHAIRIQPGLSKIALTRAVGLSSGTVSVVVGRLVDAGLVVSEGLAPSTGGRPAERLALSPGPSVLGIDLSETDARIGVLNLRGEMLATEHAPLPRLRRGVGLSAVVKAARALVASHGPTSVGVASPGQVDSDGRRVLLAANLGWKDFPLADALEADLGRPVVVSRNTQAALLAEEWWGSAPSGDPLAFVTVGSGIGAAIKVNGVWLDGATGTAGELGHISMDPAGPACRCGRRGCLESLASGQALVRIYEELHKGAGQRPPLPRARRTVAAIAAAGGDDPVAAQALATVAAELGRGLATLISITNPRVIVLGGELMDAADAVLPGVRAAVAHQTPIRSRGEVHIVPSTFGAQAPLVGACTLALEVLFAASPTDKGDRGQPVSPSGNRRSRAADSAL
jgi:predicted NBD/HSP70 family sugar kinase